MSVRSGFLVCALLVLSACSAVKTNALLLDDTLSLYAGAIRWGNMQDALGFVDPETLKNHPVSALDLARYKQVQVTAYTDSGPVHINDNEVTQVVEIGLVNINTQSARSIVDKQHWRYDAHANRWWLVSGLPDITVH